MHVVIVGGGPAGLTVAETLRRHGAQMDITMLSAEDCPPYAPPAMADHFLTGRDNTLFWKGRDVCDRLQINYKSGTQTERVDPSGRQLFAEGDLCLSYDRLVIATGSRTYAPVEGYDLPGVYNFKSLSAASALLDSARRGNIDRALIVGAGFIGVEVALLLTRLGLSVTVVEMRDRVMPRMLDAETAEIVLTEMRRQGAEVRLNTRAMAFTGKRRVKGVELESGENVHADVFIAATGIKPNIAFLEDSGINVDWGIPVDNRLRTNSPDVFAAGDVAEGYDRMTGERYVHAIFPNAVAQGQIVALNILGYDIVYEGAESMNSLKHVGIPVIAVGAPDGEETLRSRDGNTLRKIFLNNQRIVGFRLAGDIRGAGTLRSLMLGRSDVSQFRNRLLNPRFGFADRVFSTPAVVTSRTAITTS